MEAMTLRDRAIHTLLSISFFAIAGFLTYATWHAHCVNGWR